MADENATRGNNDPNDVNSRNAKDGNSERGGDAGRSGGADRNAGAGASDRNSSAEPPPALSEKGGIVPQEDNPSQFNDRSRDRDLNESR